MTFNINTRDGRAALAAQIQTDIDAYTLQAYPNDHRSHLGASKLGHTCPRHIWYNFRWVKRPTFSPRMLRLFQRGHREEATFIALLRGIGFTVEEHDENGKQFRIAAHNGHFGGSMDGQAATPERYGPLPRLLLEFKTKGTGKGFNDLKAKGVALTNEEHWVQMCVYGARVGITHALYMSVNKNDDDLHLEIVELDHALAEGEIAKAGDIIAANVAPRRISNDPNFWKCNFCDYKGICHLGEAVEKNCRSCVHASATHNAQWHCGHWGNVIPEDFIKVGCNDWSGVK